MSILRILLFPLAALYRLVTDFRNHLYDIGNRPSVEFDRVIISVGNLTVGGTGKTPMVEYLVRQLMPHLKVGVLSRGYKRTTRGFRLAGPEDNAETLGDEPMQYHAKFRDKVTVAIGEERALAIPEMLLQQPDLRVILLDDAYQHRRVKPQLNILLSDYYRPFYRDQVMPMGWLREARKHADRADVVIVTKCPKELGEQEIKDIEKEIQKYCAQDAKVFFAGIDYLEPKVIEGEKTFVTNIFLFSGIANSEPLEDYLGQRYNLLGHRKYTDHYSFKEKDIKDIIAQFESFEQEDKCLLTTEKDMVRLIGSQENMRLLRDYPVFYLPIELYFLRNGDFFAQYLLDTVNQLDQQARNN